MPNKSKSSSKSKKKQLRNERILTRRKRKQAPSSKRRLAAIMFTDVVGYTALTQRNEALALRLLEEHRRLLRPIFRSHHGKEIDTIGDAFLVEFASALDAIKCSLQIQQTLKELNSNRTDDRKIFLRIGIHLGDVVHSRKKVSGDAVNIASRIEPLAPPGGVCLTGEVYNSVVNKVDCSFQSMGNPHLKNVSTPIEVYMISKIGGGRNKETTTLYRDDVLTKHRIAVLPFQNISLDPNDEYFADGMTEELISTMSKISGLKVIARTSVMGYKDSRQKKIEDIARELQVGSILEGSVRKSSDKLRVTAQLIDSKTSEHLWAESYSRDLKDVFAIQSEISETVAQALKVKLLPEEKTRLKKQPTKNPEAYATCLKGIYYETNASSEDDLKKALKYFERAIEIDSSFALAYSWIAECYTTLVQAGHLSPKDGIPQAEQSAWRALELDPGLADAHRSLGFLLIMRKEHDWKGAEREIKKALELNPSVPGGHELYAWFLTFMGRLDEAFIEARKAIELDPISVPANQAMALVLYYKRDYDGAIAQLKRIREFDSNNRGTSHLIGLCYLEKSQFDQAIEEFNKTLEPSKEKADLSLSYLGLAYARSGRAKEAMNILNNFKEIRATNRPFVPALMMAWVTAGLGDKDQTIDLLERAYQEGDLMSLQDLKVSPVWDSIRSDQRFASLLHKIGL